MGPSYAQICLLYCLSYYTMAHGEFQWERLSFASKGPTAVVIGDAMPAAGVKFNLRSWADVWAASPQQLRHKHQVDFYLAHERTAPCPTVHTPRWMSVNGLCREPCTAVPPSALKEPLFRLHRATAVAACREICKRPSATDAWIECCTPLGGMLAATAAAGYRTVFLLGVAPPASARVPASCLVQPATLESAQVAAFAQRLGLRSRVQFVTLDGPSSPLAKKLPSMTLGAVYAMKGRVHIPAREGVTAAMAVRCCDVDRISYHALKAGRYLRDYDGRRPIAMTGAMRGWKANTAWHASFFSQDPYGKRTVEVLGIRAGAKGPTGLPDLFRSLYPINMTVAEFAAVAHHDTAMYGKYLFLDNNLFAAHPWLADAYINPIPPMFRENQYIPPPRGREAGRGDTFLSFFWGARGSRSGLHRDPWGWTSWIAVLYGRKAFKLFPVNASHQLHTYPDDFDRSPVDAFNPDYEAYPRFATLKPIEVVVGPGDVICLMDYYHQAYNLEESMAVSGNIINHNNVERIIFESIDRGKPAVGRDLMDHVQKRDMDLFRRLARRWNVIFPPGGRPKG